MSRRTIDDQLALFRAHVSNHCHKILNAVADHASHEVRSAVPEAASRYTGKRSTPAEITAQVQISVSPDDQEKAKDGMQEACRQEKIVAALKKLGLI